MKMSTTKKRATISCESRCLSHRAPLQTSRTTQKPRSRSSSGQIRTRQRAQSKEARLSTKHFLTSKKQHRCPCKPEKPVKRAKLWAKLTPIPNWLHSLFQLNYFRKSEPKPNQFLTKNPHPTKHPYTRRSLSSWRRVSRAKLSYPAAWTRVAKQEEIKMPAAKAKVLCDLRNPLTSWIGARQRLRSHLGLIVTPPLSKVSLRSAYPLTVQLV